MKKPNPEIQMLVNEIHMHEIMSAVRQMEIEEGKQKLDTQKKHGRKINLSLLKRK